MVSVIPTQNENWERISNKLVWYSFILSLMIVSYHAYNVPIYSLDTNDTLQGKMLYHFQTYVAGIQNLAIPSFFMISGFLFYRNFSITNTLNKYKSRFFTLLIPYLVWNSVAFLIFAIFTHTPFIAAYINMGAVDLTVNGIAKGIFMGEYNALWFVRVLIGLVILAPVFYYLLRNRIIGAITLSILYIIHWFLYVDEFTILYGSLFFFFGGYISIHYFKIAIKKYSNFLFYISLFVSILISFALINQWILSYTPIRQTTLLIFCITIWIISDKVNFPVKKPWWVHISFFISCSHGVILESTEKIILIVLGNNVFGAAIDYVFAPIITFIIIITIATLLKKYLPRTWKIINGNRT